MNNSINIKNNTLALGDNLELLKLLPNESIDLIYLDPPFNSNRNYIAVDENQVNYFKDVWKGVQFTYLDFLSDRLHIMRQKLKPTGSLYLHCDPTWSHYIKIMMDKVFGQNNFRNEIIWKYETGGRSKKDFSSKHDIIFKYSKTNKYVMNNDAIGIPYEKARSNHMKKEIDPDGSVWYTIKSGGKIYRYSTTKLVPPSDVWIDISHIQQKDPQRVGYPTQKPLALLERIIKASSNEEDTVLDPFMGSGTTLVTAHNLKRKFIGFDMSASALITAKSRLNKLNADYKVYKAVWDYEEIRNSPPFEFEKYIVEQLNGISNEKQRGDMGIDGRIIDKINKIIQVKRSDNIGRNVVDNFTAAMARENVTHGIVAAFSFGSGAEKEAARLRSETDINIELKPIDTIIKVNKPPTLKLTIEKNIITAKAEDPDGEVVNFTWWIDGPQNSSPYTLRDTKGTFDIKGIKPKPKEIWCRVTDNSGNSTSKSINMRKK